MVESSPVRFLLHFYQINLGKILFGKGFRASFQLFLSPSGRQRLSDRMKRIGTVRVSVGCFVFCGWSCRVGVGQMGRKTEGEGFRLPPTDFTLNFWGWLDLVRPFETYPLPTRNWFYFFLGWSDVSEPQLNPSNSFTKRRTSSSSSSSVRVRPCHHFEKLN